MLPPRTAKPSLNALQANSESFVMFILGKATSRWTRSRGDQSQLVPAFNGFQVRGFVLLAVTQGSVLLAVTRLLVLLAVTRV